MRPATSRWRSYAHEPEARLPARRGVRRAAARLRERPRLVEFALSLPVLTTLVLVGLETANLAMAHLRVSNIAMLASDNASRVRDSIDESDVIELLIGAKMTGDSIGFRRSRPHHPLQHRAQHGRRERHQHRPVDPLAALRRRQGRHLQLRRAGHRAEQCLAAGGRPRRATRFRRLGHRDHAGRGRLRLSAARSRARSSARARSATKARSTSASAPTRRSPTSTTSPRKAAPPTRPEARRPPSFVMLNSIQHP